MNNEEDYRLETDHHLPDHGADRHCRQHGIAKLLVMLVASLALIG